MKRGKQGQSSTQCESLQLPSSPGRHLLQEVVPHRSHRSSVHQPHISYGAGQPGRGKEGSSGRRCPHLSHTTEPHVSYGAGLVASPCKALPFGGVSSMSFFWQKVAGKMAWEEAW